MAVFTRGVCGVTTVPCWLPVMATTLLLGLSACRAGGAPAAPGVALQPRTVAVVDEAVRSMGLQSAGDHVVVAWADGDGASAASLAWSRDRGRTFAHPETRSVSGEAGGLTVQWVMKESRPWWRRFIEARPAVDVRNGAASSTTWAIRRLGDGQGAEVSPPADLANAPSVLRAPRPGMALMWAGPDEQLNLTTLWADAAERTLTLFRFPRRGAAHLPAKTFDIPVVVTRDLPPAVPVAAVPIRGGVMVAWAEVRDGRTHLLMREIGLDALCAPPTGGVRVEYVSAMPGASADPVDE